MATAVEDGGVVFQRPEATLGEEPCIAYRAGLDRFSRDRVVATCQQRFPEEACAFCFDSADAD